MKIGVISNLYPPFTRGGAERIVELTVQGLSDAGHDVFVISTKPENGLEVVNESNAHVYRFRPFNLFYYLDDYKHNIIVRFIWNLFDVFNLSSALTVWKILQVEKPELVITHNLKGIGMLIPLVIKKLKIQHVHVLHDIQLVNPSGLLIWRKEKSFVQNGFPTKIYQLVLRYVFSSVTKAIFPSLWLKGFYEAHSFFNKSEKSVISNPIGQLDEVVKIKTKKQNSFLCLGQLEKHKGVDWLLNFWIKNKIQAKLIVAGTGSLDLTKYRNLENIEIIGFIERDQINNLFSRTDFLVFPSLCYENSPTVIIESMQNATPVIVSNIGGSAELVNENQNGFIFEPMNETNLLDVVQKSINMNDLEYQQMSAQALESVNDFKMQSYIDAILA